MSEQELDLASNLFKYGSAFTDVLDALTMLEFYPLISDAPEIYDAAIEYMTKYEYHNENAESNTFAFLLAHKLKEI
jgi:hypothetical protein